MSIELIVVAAIVIGALFAARALLQPKKRPRSEDVFSTVSTRGEWMNMVIGTRRVSPNIGLVCDKHSRDEGGGGKGFGGGPATTVWYESGWHQLTIGSGDEIKAILQNNKVIYEGPLTSASAPSGTTIEIPGGEGSFTIYWGGADQPVNTVLGHPSRTGANSSWPFLVYIYWSPKRLGGGETWPTLEYVVTCGCPEVTLQDSSFWLDDGESKGVNGAHALHMLLTADYPIGRGFSLSKADNDTLESLGVLCETEHLPMNILIERGTSFEAVIQAILQDIGCFMPEIQSRLAFLPLREATGDVPVLGDDVIVSPDLERSIDRGDSPVSRIVFTFKDETDYGYRDADIPFDDDAEFSDTGGVDASNIPITTITHPSVAAKVARRRAQEGSLDNSVTAKVLRGARLLTPGQVFDRPGLGRLRVLGMKRLDDSPVGEVECILDVYGVPDILDGMPSGGSSGGSLSPEPDIAFMWLELPAEITSEVAIAVFRIRAHQQIQGANIYVSTNDTSYDLCGAQNSPAAGGLIDSSISGSTADVIVAGPIFEADNADATSILDLSGDTVSWQAGRLLAIIGTEVFYLESVTVQGEDPWGATAAFLVDDAILPTEANGFRYVCVTAGTTSGTEPVWPIVKGETVVDGTCVWEARYFRYQMNNMIRARLESTMAAHSAGDRVYIQDRTAVSIITHPIIAPGNFIYIKTQPFTGSSFVDLSLVTPVSGLISGLSTTEDFRVTSDGSYRVTSLGELRTIE